jgi:hypothetical protein
MGANLGAPTANVSQQNISKNFAAKQEEVKKINNDTERYLRVLYEKYPNKNTNPVQAAAYAAEQKKFVSGLIDKVTDFFKNLGVSDENVLKQKINETFEIPSAPTVEAYPPIPATATTLPIPVTPEGLNKGVAKESIGRTFSSPEQARANARGKY